MNSCKLLFGWVICIILSVNILCAQDEETDNLPVDRMDHIRLVFNRGLLIGSLNSDDQAPINGSLSGSLFLGVGVKFGLIGNKMGLRITPGVNWYKLNYDQEDEKQFPTDTTFGSEKHRFTYVELPIGIYFNFSQDEDGDPKLFAEVGGFTGYKIGAIYKRKFEENGRTVKIKRTDVPGIENWRLGVYARLGYKRWALYYSYLLSDIFDSFVTEDGSELSRNPDLPPRMEVGISFFL